MDLTEQIEFYIGEADCLSGIIQRSNYVIDRMEGTPDLQEVYEDELMPIIQEYLGVIRILESLFESYFETERQTDKIRNLRYRRLYKLIKTDLAKPVPPGLNP